MQQNNQAHGRKSQGDHSSHGRPYLMFWVNMILGLIVMYVVMFSMIDGWGDFHNNLNMFYMALSMWAPMGIFMLATMRGLVQIMARSISTMIAANGMGDIYRMYLSTKRDHG